jgi:23S rRNA A2030 N6-methylase RlmJ
MEVHLSDVAKPVAAHYEDLNPLGLPQNVSVHFVAADGFARLRAAVDADMVLIDPPFAPDPDADWRRLREASHLLKERGTRFLAWYPIFSDIEPADLMAATGFSASEVVWAPTGTEPGERMAGCGILASRDCGDMLAASAAQLERLATCLGGKFRRWAHGL